MKHKLILITFLVSIFAGCSDKHDAPRDHGNDSDSTAGELKISLDHGSKWKMDEHTRSMFKAMDHRLKAGGDILTLAEGLQSDVDELIQGCTMTGEAHNHLHVFLTEYIPAVQEVSTTGSEESLNKVKGLLQEYPQYFE